MPKKRRTPKQKAASRRNLEKARAARHSGKIPSGKSKAYVTVYHTTTEAGAKGIRAKGFQASKRFPQIGKTKAPVWVSTLSPDKPRADPVFLVPETFGKKDKNGKYPTPITFGMRVKKKLTKPDPHARAWKHSRIVPAQALSGAKIYRVK